jgi:hypothetical protein
MPAKPVTIVDRYLIRQFLQLFVMCYVSLAGLYAGYQRGFNRFAWRIEHAARRLQKATVAAPRREQLAVGATARAGATAAVQCHLTAVTEMEETIMLSRLTQLSTGAALLGALLAGPAAAQAIRRLTTRGRPERTAVIEGFPLIS